VKKRKSIVSILYQNIMITIIFFVVIAVVINGIVSANLYRGAVDTGNMVTRSVASHIQERMGEPERDILEVQKIISGNLLTESSTNGYLESVVKNNPYFMAMEILDANGKVLYAAPAEFNSVGMDRSGEIFYQKAKKDSGFFWSEIFTLMMNGQPTISVSSIDQGETYVVYLDIQELSRVSIDYSKYYGDNIEIFIMDNNGTYISSADESMISERRINKDIGRIQESVKNDRDYIENKETNQFINVAYIDNPRWYVAQYSSLDYVMVPIRNTYLLFYLFLGILIFLSFVYYRKAKSLSREINKFSEQAKSIEAGVFDVEINDQKFGELFKLSENFNSMMNEIKDRDLCLVQYAYIDTLTGLPNRRAMMEKLEEYIEKKQSFAIIYFDLDEFKNINDSCGHYNGDIVLNNVAKRIIGCIEGNGLLARIGGDEFLCLLSDGYDENSIGHMMERIIESVSKSFEVNNLEMFIGISAGIAFYPENADNFADLLKFSDMAMYSAKNKGMNRFEYFKEELKADFDRKMGIERHLRSAIEKDEFKCVFQPQIELSSNEIIGLEALIRWNNKDLGVVSPDEFIQIAEERNLIEGITEWMLKRSCESGILLQKRFGKPYKMSVNVSVSDLKRKDFPEKVMKILQETGMNPELLEIEITENMLIDNYKEMIGMLVRLKEYGIGISLDDFGKGYSSLSYLNKLPIDTLKIDREFLDSSHFHEKGYQLIEAIISIAEKFNFTVIAEGIETKKQFDILKKNNCYGGQGYLMCRPIPIEELIIYMERGGKNE